CHCLNVEGGYGEAVNIFFIKASLTEMSSEDGLKEILSTLISSEHGGWFKDN
ncbi:11852_t:CDS:1, partial [Acaulospora morrowiae]